LKARKELSPNAKVYALVNKVDKVDEKNINNIIANKQKQFGSKVEDFEIKYYPCSIFENSICKAFSHILSNVLQNSDKIQKFLEEYATACNASEVILYDKKTLLAIGNFSNKQYKDEKRIETISYSIKKFVSNYKNISNKFNELIINNKANTIYLDEFANSTYIMVVVSDKNISLELLKLNIKISKKEFEKIF
jgi:Ras-related GTP-binding protein A/B